MGKVQGSPCAGTCPQIPGFCPSERHPNPATHASDSEHASPPAASFWQVIRVWSQYAPDAHVAPGAEQSPPIEIPGGAARHVPEQHVMVLSQVPVAQLCDSHTRSSAQAPPPGTVPLMAPWQAAIGAPISDELQLAA